MNINPQYLEPFDLKRAKAGETVVFYRSGGVLPVVDACWSGDEDGDVAVLCERPNKSRVWVIARHRELLIYNDPAAPKTEPYWYGILRMKNGDYVGAYSRQSEEHMRSYEGIQSVHCIRLPVEGEQP